MYFQSSQFGSAVSSGSLARMLSKSGGIIAVGFASSLGGPNGVTLLGRPCPDLSNGFTLLGRSCPDRSNGFIVLSLLVVLWFNRQRFVVGFWFNRQRFVDFNHLVSAVGSQIDPNDDSLACCRGFRSAQRDLTQLFR